MTDVDTDLPSPGTARDTWVAIGLGTLITAAGLFFVLAAFNEVQASSEANLEDIGAAPAYFLIGSGIMTLSFLFVGWKSKRDRWLMWSLVASFLTMSSVVFLGILGPVVALPTGAAIVLRLDGSGYVRARVFAVVMFVAAFVAGLTLGYLALVILIVFPFLSIAAADAYVDRRQALNRAV